MHSRIPILALLAGVLFSAATAQISQPAPRGLTPSPVAGFDYTAPFFPNARHDPAVAAPDAVLGFPAGSQAASHAQIEAVVKALATRTSRCRLVEYGRTHEGRALYYLVIASEANLRRLESLKADYARLADPRRISRAEADQLAATLPALAWMAYAIHGNEASAGDAAMLVAHHLVASTDADVRALLEELVIVIDPLMNPDGRDRFVTDLARNRTSQPNFDDQSALHTGQSPSGRSNHYLFDMNRDWVFASQPETQGRIRAINEWNPHYLVEGHEMGSQSTFAFYPASEAVNHNVPANVRKWEARFGADLAAAFDQRGWRYFNGEPFDNWYPGYSSAWAALRGTIDNLYEQASIQTDAIRRAEGTLHTYREGVHKQIVATMANLTSLSRNRREVLADFVAEKRQCAGPEATVPELTFVLPPSANLTRQRQFTELMALQGIEVAAAGAAFTASGRDRLGRAVTEQSFPAGSLLISSRQPLARLVLALLEFDPRMKPEFLVDERRELLRKGESKIYDVTGWSLPMLYNLETVVLAGGPPAAAQVRPLAPALPVEALTREAAQTTVGFVLNGADDRSVVAAGRLMERAIKVRVADKTFQFDGRTYPRGSVLITRKDNTAFAGDLVGALREVCTELKISAVGLGTGYGPGELPDLGGRHFRLLHAPRIALLGRESAGTFGECWYTIDHVLGLRASYLELGRVTAADLRRYNVIIVPEARADALKDKTDALKNWVESGGTLVAIGSAAAAFARDPGGIGSVRLLPAIFGKPEPFLQTVIRDWEGTVATVEEDKVWSFTAPSGETAPKIPWQGAALRLDKDDKPSEDELKRRDEWRRIFMPHGAVVAGRVDDQSWLTVGSGGYLPVMFQGNTILMVPPGAEAPVRLGYFNRLPTPAPSSTAASASAPVATETKKDDAKKAEKTLPGWTIAPPGYELRLRMSGLLWPEAAERLANSAYLTREQIKAGQVICFAASPMFRAGAVGTTRLFTNAVVFGPGLGASQPIVP